MSDRLVDVVSRLIENIIADLDIELVDVEYQKEAGQYILRIFIDKSTGVTLDDCQTVSRQLSRLLDEKDLITDAYILEVSSPGIDRPLKKPADFTRFSGSNVDLSTYTPVYQNMKKFTAELVGLEDDQVVLLIDGKQIEIPRDQIAKIRLAVEF